MSSNDNLAGRTALTFSSFQMAENSQQLSETIPYAIPYSLLEEEEEIPETQSQLQHDQIPCAVAVTDFICLDFHTNPPQLFKVACLTEAGKSSEFAFLEFQRFMVISFNEQFATVSYLTKITLTQTVYKQIDNIPLTFLYQPMDAVLVEPSTQKDYDESLCKKAKQALDLAEKERKKAVLLNLRREELEVERQKVLEQIAARNDRKLQLEEKLQATSDKLAQQLEQRAELDVLICKLQRELETFKREREDQMRAYEEKIHALTVDSARDTLIADLRTQIQQLQEANRQMEAHVLDARNSMQQAERPSSSQKKKQKLDKPTGSTAAPVAAPAAAAAPAAGSIASPSIRRSFTHVFDSHVVDWLQQEEKSLKETVAFHDKFKSRLDYGAEMTSAAFLAKWGYRCVQDKFAQYIMTNLPVNVLVKCTKSHCYSVEAKCIAVDTTFATFDKDTGLNWKFILQVTIAQKEYKIAVSHKQITGFFESEVFVKRHGTSNIAVGEMVFKDWLTQQ